MTLEKMSPLQTKNVLLAIACTIEISLGLYVRFLLRDEKVIYKFKLPKIKGNNLLFLLFLLLLLSNNNREKRERSHKIKTRNSSLDQQR